MKHIIGCLFACIGMIWCAASACAGIKVEHARVRVSSQVADTRLVREPAQQLFEKAMALVRE